MIQIFNHQFADLKALLKHYRLNEDEYKLIQSLLGREPRAIEWALFSALWSEHCSYKSSKVHLRKFSYRNSKVLESEGENAGVVDLGQGEKIAFKMESHNHPSFIEPFQGAATGVGGILRDIFTMGARPIAVADYLCFGSTQAPRMEQLVKGVVSGISHYGNCVGVPTVTGQTYFDERYDKNILVNAMAVGLFTEGQKMALSKAKGIGNWVVYVGSYTGVDGVHGASMASESFDQDLSKKKPNVQIGDPFFEKLLIESCLEVLEKDLVVAMQDMGAAGLTSSSFEMASKGNVGFKIDLNKVPLRNADMTPEDILLSESQERMLLICEPLKFAELQSVFHKWGLEAICIGEVTKERKVELIWNNETLTSIDPDLLVEKAPQYRRTYQEEAKSDGFDLQNLDAIEMDSQVVNYSVGSKISSLCSELNRADKNWIYQQYDQRVGVRTIRDASQSVAFLRLPSDRALSIAVGCRPGLMKLKAEIGAYDSVFYPALQMAIKGAKVLAVTDCLNFGNPEKVNIMTEFVKSVEAIALASRLIDAPVVSGNVSFYNETQSANIISTPATGLVGLRENHLQIPSDQFQAENHSVWLLRLNMINWTKRSGFFEPSWVRDFYLGVLKLQSQSPWASSKMIGEQGMVHTLRQMASLGFSCQPEVELSGFQDDVLYSCLIAVDFEDEAELKEHYKSAFSSELYKHLEFVRLGKTIKDTSSVKMIGIEEYLK